MRRLATQQPVECRELDNGQTVIEGYAAVFYQPGNSDTEFELRKRPRMVERVANTAFDRLLGETHDVRGLFNHDPNHLLGRTTAGTMTLSKDERGLRYAITLDTEQESHRDLRRRVQRGDLTGSSFGFNIRKDHWERSDGLDVRNILDVELFDVGPVTFPAYAATTAAARSEGDTDEAEASHALWQHSIDAQLQPYRDRLPKLD